MTVESFLQYWTTHNESIIQWLLFTIVLLTIFVLSRMVMGKSSDGLASIDVSSQPLTETLGKILEETAAMKSQLAAGVPVAGSGTVSAATSAVTTVAGSGGGLSNGGAPGGGSVEFENAKAELEKRENEIAALKVQLQDMPKSGDASQYLSKIKELEGKLSEYEILEDDIADLSLFKEENARLKSELEALKAQGPAGAPATPSVSSDFVGEFEAAIQTASGASAPAPAGAPTPAAPASTPSVESGTSVEMTPEPMPNPVVAPIPAPPVPGSVLAQASEPAVPSSGVPPSAVSPDITEDILAEFSKESSANEIISQMANSVTAPTLPPVPPPVASSAPTPAAPSDLNIEVDPNKMIEEISALSAGSEGTSAGASSLEGEPDMDKIISEVGQLQENKA